MRRSDRLRAQQQQPAGDPDVIEKPPPPQVDLPAQNADLNDEEKFQLVRRLFQDKNFPGSFSGNIYPVPLKTYTQIVFIMFDF
jgi:hypothetical protein